MQANGDGDQVQLQGLSSGLRFNYDNMKHRGGRIRTTIHTNTIILTAA